MVRSAVRGRARVARRPQRRRRQRRHIPVESFRGVDPSRHPTPQKPGQPTDGAKRIRTADLLGAMEFRAPDRIWPKPIKSRLVAGISRVCEDARETLSGLRFCSFGRGLDAAAVRDPIRRVAKFTIARGFDDESRRWAVSTGETAAELVVDVPGPRMGHTNNRPEEPGRGWRQPPLARAGLS